MYTNQSTPTIGNPLASNPQLTGRIIGPDCGNAPITASPMQQALESLAMELRHQEETLRILRERLEPVLQPAVPDPRGDAKTGAERQPHSEQVERVNSIARSIAWNTANVGDLIQRLEV